MGFRAVAAGPLVRSSYGAHEMFESEQDISLKPIYSLNLIKGGLGK
jgi:hypothetical protein